VLGIECLPEVFEIMLLNFPDEGLHEMILKTFEIYVILIKI